MHAHTRKHVLVRTRKQSHARFQITVAILERNLLRLIDNFHSSDYYDI